MDATGEIVTTKGINRETAVDPPDGVWYTALRVRENRPDSARRDGRVAYCGALEKRCAAMHRGFESLSLRLNK
jgi:hypothetical protein